MDNTTEIYKPVEGFRGYEVSNLGNVKRGSKIYKGYLASDGYRRMALYKDGEKIYKYVHHLVADAFIEPVEGKKFVVHINGDRADNRLENLSRDAKKTMSWRHDTARVEAARARAVNMHFANMKAVRCVETGEVFQSITAAARHYGLYPQGIGSAARGEYPRCGGYSWEYVEET